MLQNFTSQITAATEWLQVNSGAVQAVFAGLLVLLTAFYVIFTNKLRKATDTLATIAANQNNLMAVSQRAYLSVAPLGVEPFGPNGVAHIVVRNVGKLPAQDVSWFIDHAVLPNGKWAPPPIEEERFYGERFVIQPVAEMERSHNAVVPTEIVAKFMREPRSYFFYVWGEVRYRDCLEKSPRFTKFCHRYDNRGARQIGAGRYKNELMLIAESMRYHQYGNDAD